jgi:host factor-I protein
MRLKLRSQPRIVRIVARVTQAGFFAGHLARRAEIENEVRSAPGRSAMDTKPAQNIQDSFLNTARKERMNITIYLVSGVKLTGRIRSFDKYSVVLDTNNQEQLIFKHAISTIAMGRTPHTHVEKPAAVAAPASASHPSASDAASATSGTEG